MEHVPYYYQTNIHKVLLSAYMKDAPDLKSKIEAMDKPERRSLIRLTKAYQKEVCNDESCVVYEKKIPSIKETLEPTIGIINYKRAGTSFTQYGGNVLLRLSGTNERVSAKLGVAYQGERADSAMLDVPFQLQYIYPVYRIKPKIAFGFCYNNISYQYKERYNFHTLTSSVGFDFMIYKFISLSANFDTQYTSLFDSLFSKNEGFGVYSYAYTVGLSIEL